MTTASPRVSLRAFLAREGITTDAQLIDQRPDGLVSDMPAGSRHWRVTITRNTPGAVWGMVVYFSQGPAIEQEPTAEDVLDCLASDYAGYDNARSFEDWCGEYGYDTDSRKAEAIWREVSAQAHELENLLGRELAQQLAYNTERL
jgi:hypothetical protein